MIDLISKDYWSKSKAFLLPFTGMKKVTGFEMDTFLDWGEHSIDNYHFMVKVGYENYDAFDQWLKKEILEVRNCCLMELHEGDGFTVLVYDLSQWSEDVDQIVGGKYSKISKEWKGKIKTFHSYMKDNNWVVNVQVWAVLYPDVKEEALDGLNAFQYLEKHYGFDAADLEALGEIASAPDRERERLFLELPEPI